MKNKRGLFVPGDKYDEAIRLLSSAKISSTSEYGIFHFDLISFIIGFVLAIIFGIVVF